jgi:Sec-independent protein translocase protein TatA
MFGFSAGDWLFIAGVLVVIFVCVAASDLRRRK